MSPSMRGLWRALNDPTRVRLVALLSEAELAVSEIQKITRLSQSLISAHLAVLRKVELVRTRKEGKSIYYGSRDDLPPAAASIQRAALETLQEIAEAADDRAALKAALAERRQAAQRYFNRIAGKLGKAYCPGRTWSAVGPLLAHLVAEVDIADLGAGEGWLTLLLAQRARRVIAIDNSPKMVEFAREQLKTHEITNVEFRLGDLEDPPVEAESVDMVVFSQALHHAEHPDRALVRTARLLRPGGRVVILDLQRHQFEKARDLYHDRWLGFAEADLRDWLRAAGFTQPLVQTLEPDPYDPSFRPIVASARLPSRPSLSGQIKR